MLPVFFPFLFLCRKLQESQDSMSSRLEEAEHKAQSLQTGTSLLDLYTPGYFFNWAQRNGNLITGYELVPTSENLKKKNSKNFQILSTFLLNVCIVHTHVHILHLACHQETHKWLFSHLLQHLKQLRPSSLIWRPSMTRNPQQSTSLSLADLCVSVCVCVCGWLLPSGSSIVCSWHNHPV